MQLTFCTWRAGISHLPHLDQLREMMRRERATGGPAERTFESLLGLELRPRRMREATALWERIGATEGAEARDAKWGHPDLLPVLPADDAAGMAGAIDAGAASSAGSDDAATPAAGADASATGAGDGLTVDWDAELSRLLDVESGDGDDGGDAAASDADAARD